jgi:hypothetical protein
MDSIELYDAVMSEHEPEIFRPPKDATFYRYVNTRQGDILCIGFEEVKKTPAGAHIKPVHDSSPPNSCAGTRWVSEHPKTHTTCYPRFAYRDPWHAMRSFLARKKKHIQLLEGYLHGAAIAYQLAQKTVRALEKEPDNGQTL